MPFAIRTLNEPKTALHLQNKFELPEVYKFSLMKVEGLSEYSEVWKIYIAIKSEVLTFKSIKSEDYDIAINHKR